jgi:SAM-dependent methyltransferase
MNVDAIWHDLECAEYSEDLPTWHALAGRTGGPVLDVGAGTGRVTIQLAARGIDVVALDVAASLLAALECRAGELPVETLIADAREFSVDRRFSLIVVPMQTLQLFGGPAGRAAFFRKALEHLKPGAVLAAAPAACRADRVVRWLRTVLSATSRDMTTRSGTARRWCSATAMALTSTGSPSRST